MIQSSPSAPDYHLAALAGFLTGLFLIPTALNIGFRHNGILLVLPLVTALAWLVGIWLGKVLSRYLSIIYQLTKFAAVGFLNTAINFGILNLFSLITGATAGLSAGGINIPGTVIAASNSYVWNKLWVFHKVDGKGFFHDVPKFVIVTLIGLVVNSLIIIGFTSYSLPRFGLSSAAWLNVGKLLATIVGFLVDFLGYKFLVFRKKN